MWRLRRRRLQPQIPRATLPARLTCWCGRTLPQHFWKTATQYCHMHAKPVPTHKSEACTHISNQAPRHRLLLAGAYAVMSQGPGASSTSMQGRRRLPWSGDQSNFV